MMRHSALCVRPSSELLWTLQTLSGDFSELFKQIYTFSLANTQPMDTDTGPILRLQMDFEIPLKKMNTDGQGKKAVSSCAIYTVG